MRVLSAKECELVCVRALEVTLVAVARVCLSLCDKDLLYLSQC
jgi:hypothetical protein